MKPDTQNMKLTVIQETLDQLFGEHLIPFELTARKVNEDGFGEYEVPFYDSRIHSFRFSWKEGDSFKEVIRLAVLDRVNRMNDALNDLSLFLRPEQVLQGPNTFS